MRVFAFTIAIICLSVPSLFGQARTLHSPASTEGLIEPFQTVRVAAPESATIADVLVRQGQVVQKGSPLVQMDIDILQSALLVAKAKADARAKLDAAAIELDVKQRRVEILKSLGKDNASSEELIRATADCELAKAAVLAAQEERSQNQLETKRIEMQLEKRTIRSPIHGVVVRVHHQIGEFVTNLDPVVVTVAELSRLRAVIYPPTELAQTLSVDAVVGLRLEDGQSVDVTVDFVSPVTDADSRTVRTELVLENPKGKFRSGARCWLGIQPTTKVEQNSGLTDVRGVSAFSTKDLK